MRGEGGGESDGAAGNQMNSATPAFFAKNRMYSKKINGNENEME